ncbi:uncharacterized protein BBA_04185 [Beauveria bassiana ARSEF 2860]|uniref:Uncharacterized protein n=1 Tax=Beauveria bassiana (strain ARSEF 2860) TaxID=655819 RepID=J4UP32_BEAB2|nr:uncharacterized protein BBA_04185 [Beauveria bassiana ARSEF 2860]EJP66892.1 hypothetical protein BBA_04185 [Beauveria bassiana ARSEF 2860]
MGIANTGQRNRAASITSVSNDVLPIILSEEQDQQSSSEKTWDFGGVDSVFFDASLEEQDDITDQCLVNSPPPSTDAHAHAQVRAVNKAEAAAKPTALVDGSESSIAKGLLNGQLVSTDANELSQDSCSRILAMFPQQSHNHRYDDIMGCKPQQSMHASDFMQPSHNTSACFGTTGASSATTTGSQSFSWPRSESRPGTASRSADSSSSTTQDVVSLERIREFVEDAGYESLEAMMAAYYSANLSAGANARPAQAVGRSRRLRSFLSAIHRSHVEWGEQERNAYREEIVRAAEGIYADELANMVHGATETSSNKLLSIAGSSKPTAETSRVYIAHRIQNLISDPDIQDFMRKDRKDLQDTSSKNLWYFQFVCHVDQLAT